MKNKRVNSKSDIATRCLKKHIAMNDAQHHTPHPQHDTSASRPESELDLDSI
jgi:hypothetical protein